MNIRIVIIIFVKGIRSFISKQGKPAVRELALKNTTEEVQNVIFKNLSKRLAAMIKEDMEFMGPVRMKDVEEAQQKIVSVIRKLEDAGEIVISRGGGDEIVV